MQLYTVAVYSTPQKSFHIHSKYFAYYSCDCYLDLLFVMLNLNSIIPVHLVKDENFCNEMFFT